MELAFGALIKLVFKVWFWKGCSLDRCFLSVFGIVAKFPWRKFGSISPYFRDENSATLHLRGVIAHKTLSLASFRYENTAMGMPHFHRENPAKFCIWCTMAHRQGFTPVYTMRANMLMLGWASALQSIKHIDVCRIHGETNVTWWHKLGRSHRDDCAQNIAWICTHSNCLGHIPTLQGQENLWLEMVAHIAMRVHHTKCTITHIQAYINIHTSCIMLSHRVGN